MVGLEFLHMRWMDCIGGYRGRQHWIEPELDNIGIALTEYQHVEGVSRANFSFDLFFLFASIFEALLSVQAYS